MPITPHSLLPRRTVPEFATGPVVALGVGSVSVQIRPGLTVLASTDGPYAVGQMVSVLLPGGNLASPQIIGGAAGSAPRIRQVVV